MHPWGGAPTACRACAFSPRTRRRPRKPRSGQGRCTLRLLVSYLARPWPSSAQAKKVKISQGFHSLGAGDQERSYFGVIRLVSSSIDYEPPSRGLSRSGEKPKYVLLCCPTIGLQQWRHSLEPVAHRPVRSALWLSPRGPPPHPQAHQPPWPVRKPPLTGYRIYLIYLAPSTTAVDRRSTPSLGDPGRTDKNLCRFFGAPARWVFPDHLIKTPALALALCLVHAALLSPSSSSAEST